MKKIGPFDLNDLSVIALLQFEYY